MDQRAAEGGAHASGGGAILDQQFRAGGGSDSPFTTHFHERFAPAELLYQLGRMDEALRWYRSLTHDLLYNGPSHYRLAQIYQARGDKRTAIQHYREFVETWRNCDPMLRPKLQQAELELARLP